MKFIAFAHQQRSLVVPRHGLEQAGAMRGSGLQKESSLDQRRPEQQGQGRAVGARGRAGSGPGCLAGRCGAGPAGMQAALVLEIWRWLTRIKYLPLLVKDVVTLKARSLCSV